MFKKLLALGLVSVVGLGVAAAGITSPGGVPIDPPPDCSSCAAAVTLPGGTVCTLAGCMENGDQVYCLYRCF